MNLRAVLYYTIKSCCVSLLQYIYVYRIASHIFSVYEKVFTVVDSLHSRHNTTTDQQKKTKFHNSSSQLWFRRSLARWIGDPRRPSRIFFSNAVVLRVKNH
uniref:(northern house mosquito) hypothetical protein n=1 Tax=Culex pipiens TaxID=7175 RepID=A0A8D8FJ41_CULPI